MRCPACRRRMEWEQPECPRCGADLTAVLALEHRRGALVAEAARRLRAGQAVGAEPILKAAEAIRGDTETAELRALAALLRGDYREAVRRHAAARKRAL